MRIPIFDATEDAYWWVLCTEKYFKLWSTPETLKMTVAGLAMKGPALTWWLHWYPCHRWVDWDSFTTIFLWQFKPEWRVVLPLPDDKEELEDEPQQLVQGDSIGQQPTMEDERINDSNQFSSSHVVSDLDLALSIEDFIVQSSIPAEIPLHTPLFVDPENKDGDNMIIDTVPVVVAERKEPVAAVGDFVVPDLVSDSDLAFVTFPPPPHKPSESELSALSHDSSKTTRPPLFQSPETHPTPPKPPRPPDCVSILISPSLPTSETTAKTISVLVLSSPPPEHIHSSQPHAKIEPHFHHRGFHNDVDFAIPPKPPDLVVIRTLSTFLQCWWKQFVQHYKKEGEVIIVQIETIAAILFHNFAIGHNCSLSGGIWLELIFLATDEKSTFSYALYVNDTGSSCGVYVYPYLHVCYYDPGGICYPHHASNFGDDIIVDGFAFDIWPESDGFMDDIITHKFTKWSEGTSEYEQSSTVSMYKFELIRVVNPFGYIASPYGYT
jgi:hypothetical protein